MAVRVVVRYDKEGRLSSVEVSGDPAAVHQVLSQILHLNQALNQAPLSPAPSQAPERPAPPRQGRKSRASAQQAGAREAEPARREGLPELEGLPEYARDNPWLPLLASRAKQS